MHETYIKTPLVRFWRPYINAWLKILPISRLKLNKGLQCILAFQNHVLHRVRVQDAGWACIRIPHHKPNHNVTPTHIEPEQYNPWNNSTNKSQAPEDGCTNIRNTFSIK